METTEFTSKHNLNAETLLIAIKQNKDRSSILEQVDTKQV